MLKQFVLLVITCCLGSFATQAKIWRVNNNPGISADFTTTQQAHDGAASGDTLYFEGSPTEYGSLSCRKKLTIIGPGYFLSLNANTQAIALTAKVSSISFFSQSSGSSIMGMDLNQVSIFSNNIIISRNNFADPSGNILDWSTGLIQIAGLDQTGTAVNNVSIIQNYGVQVSILYASSGILILNNYLGYSAFAGDATNNPVMNIANFARVVAQHNVFRRGLIIAGSTIEGGGNIILASNIMVAGTITGSGYQKANNLTNAAQFGTSDGNLANINMGNVFEGTTPGDAQWKLKVGSPAIGAGVSGSDAGMFGGNTPYVLSGLPPIPSIYSFVNQPVGSNTDPIDVTIKVKSNN